jgi:penicillin-binding protein 2A
MTIKSLLKSLPLAIIAFFTVVSLNAQSDPATISAKKGKPAPNSRVEPTEASEDEAMSKDLKLTPAQKAEFKKANENYKNQAKANRTAKKEDQQRLREERMRAHKAVLTPEQAKKYDEMMAKREAKHEGKKARKAEQKSTKKAKKVERKENKAENKVIKKELDNN